MLFIWIKRAKGSTTIFNKSRIQANSKRRIILIDKRYSLIFSEN
nr:MAG TPA: hypothetical protein [Caudoviricetes sp.]